ncbi:MAG: GPI anchored serine-threonine rich family protein [Cyclobacteriaceae bacterium]|nr:GPI anchored serine-threonine rich family protein [Cyclobacteriaceae bacterium]
MVKLLSFVGIFLITSSFGQTFQNVRKRVEEDKIVVIYDLVSIEPGSRVKVEIFSSNDNFETPLSDVVGDVGMVMPGPNRRITWSAGELVQKADSISFEFTGEIVYGLTFISPSAKKNIKRGKTFTLNWQGGVKNDTVTISLLTPDQDSIHLIQTLTENTYDWEVPKDFKTGKGYTLRMVGRGNIIEHRFAIKRKIPIAWFAAPVAGILIGIIAAGGGSDDNSLPDAPSPN